MPRNLTACTPPKKNVPNAGGLVLPSPNPRSGLLPGKMTTVVLWTGRGQGEGPAGKALGRIPFLIGDGGGEGGCPVKRGRG